ncbi:general L-amino acid-binding periplasmic protein AapJ [Maritalea myrionectae]|uniref:General L-amino acid-binding periplasmic protein AapJ n=1 Tax=Maritalea myrionectae TaxID=454601 RepID=A0A2R4MFB8_9HYPH|nr:general L-amino acid-binding periplasmic protein AapJ [Maritalea myrionectae]
MRRPCGAAFCLLGVQVRTFIALVLLFFGWSSIASADTLETVRERGFVKCGANQGHRGFSNLSAEGFWSGFDVDLCRAVSAAIFSDPSRVEFVEYAGDFRMTPLRVGEVDLMSRNGYWNMPRDNVFDVVYTGVVFYDGQGIMVRDEAEVVSALELKDISVCVVANSLQHDVLERFFFNNQISYQEVMVEDSADLAGAYMAGICDAVTASATSLQEIKINAINPSQHRILPERLSKEPMGPVVRKGDMKWQTIIRWVLFAMINAEELGVNSRNIDTMAEAKNPRMRRLLGIEGEFGQALGLNATWAQDIIRHVGNYGEVYERNFGNTSGLMIPRGANELWTKGGLHYAPPIR